MNEIITSINDGGNPNPTTGTGYRVAVPWGFRKLHFDKYADRTVTLKLEVGVCEIILTDSFWNRCNELKHQLVGKLLIKHQATDWVKNKPNQVLLKKLEEGVFEVQWLNKVKS
ncbi:MAG: hypothetical protein ACI8WB_000077 [Phenylobacterium sp.]|jgi:hypothetical protein